jgi:tetratricopeptide (TPR) repeat protein
VTCRGKRRFLSAGYSQKGGAQPRQESKVQKTTREAGRRRIAALRRPAWTGRRHFCPAGLLALLLGLLFSGAVLAQDEVDARIQLAREYYNSGNFEYSEEILRQIVEKQDSTSMRYAICLQNLALIEYMNFHFGEAEKLYLKALPLTELFTGSDSMATANNLYGLSRCLRRSSRYADAEPCLHRVLTIRTHVLGEKHRLVTNSLLDIAVNCENQDKNSEALLYSEKALQLREVVFGKESSYLVPALQVYARQLRLARDSHADAVDQRLRFLNSNSRELAGVESLGREEDGSTWQSGRVP